MEKNRATILDYARMCDSFDFCGGCPLSINKNGETKHCRNFIVDCPDKANEIIVDWCKENPIKTRQSELLKLFPNTVVGDKGVIELCPLSFEGCACESLLKRMEMPCGATCSQCCSKYYLKEI